jgi:hypothetical protein
MIINTIAASNVIDNTLTDYKMAHIKESEVGIAI